MSGRIFNMDIPAHQAIQELLPWYAASQLPPHEAVRVHEHLQHCAHCRQELEWERDLRAQAAAGPLPPDLDMEAALARLLPELGAQPPLPTSTRPAPAPQLEPQPWWRLPPANKPRWLRWTLAGQWALIAGLVALLVRPSPEPAPYRVLGADGNRHGNIVVVFKPDTPERDLRRILQAQGARVIDGPTVTDAYLLAVPAPARERALQALRADNAVKLAESLDGGSLP